MQKHAFDRFATTILTCGYKVYTYLSIDFTDVFASGKFCVLGFPMNCFDKGLEDRALSLCLRYAESSF